MKGGNFIVAVVLFIKVVTAQSGGGNPFSIPLPIQPIPASSGSTGITPSVSIAPEEGSAISSVQGQAGGQIDMDRKIQPGDLLVITIVGESNLQTEFRVSASGEIQFPFLNMVKLAGLTPAEAKKRIEELLKQDYFVDPQVIVTVKEYRPTYVRVLGAVNRPGLIILPGEQRFDILDAIAYAGGFTRYAKDKVKYTHEGKTITLSLEELKRQTDPMKKIWVQHGDVIEVEERIF